MTSQDYSLIQVETDDQIILSGLYQPGDRAKMATILVHGFTSDFFTHRFNHVVAQALREQGNALILAQTRGMGLRTEFVKTTGEGVYVGSFGERLEDAHRDITAFVEFLKDEGYTNIALMGHSLGTIKVVRYLFEGAHKDEVRKLVLLAPFDKNVFMEQKARDKWQEFLARAKAEIEAGNGQQVVPVPEYEDYEVTYDTFYSWYSPSELGSMWDFYRRDYDFPALQKISVPVKAILGDQDEFVTYPEFGESPQLALDVIKQRVPQSETVLLEQCGHTFRGCEDRLAAEVAGFIKG